MDFSISYNTQFLEFPSDDGLHVEAELLYQTQTEPRPLIFILHGFRVHMDWGFFPLLSRELLKAGAHTMRLNFRRNGYTTDECGNRLFNADIFARNTVSDELRDVSSVLDSIRAHSVLPSQARWDGRILLLGHSRGAGIALLVAKKYAEISGLVLWSPISRFDRSTERQKKQWREQGVLEVRNSGSGPSYRLNLSFLNDIEQHADEYNLQRIVTELQIPVQVIVGEQDIVSGPREARQLLSGRQDAESMLTVLPTCNHQFNCTEDCIEASPCLNAAIRQTCRSFALPLIET